MPGGRSDQAVVVLILLLGAVGRGAKGLACSRLVRFANQGAGKSGADAQRPVRSRAARARRAR